MGTRKYEYMFFNGQRIARRGENWRLLGNGWLGNRYKAGGYRFSFGMVFFPFSKERKKLLGEKLHENYCGPSSASGPGSEVERKRAGSSLMAYPTRADMMEPTIVRNSEPA